jgi:hypothetical protein
MKLPTKFAEAVKLLNFIVKYPARITTRTPIFLIGVPSGFPQYLQPNIRIVLLIRP